MPIKIQEHNKPSRKQLISNPDNPLHKRVEAMLHSALASVLWRHDSHFDVQTWDVNESCPHVNDALFARIGEGKVVCYRITSGPTQLAPLAPLELELHSICRMDNGVPIPLYVW